MRYRIVISPISLIVVCLTVLAGCGGDGSGGSGPDTTPPTVIAVHPTDGTTSFAVDSTLRVTFSENMAAGSFSNSSLVLSPSVAGNVTYNNRVLTFTPSAPFAEDVNYTATLDTTVTDASGNKLAAQYTWSFGTNNPPRVLQTSPSNGAVQVPIGEHIAISFSEDLDTTALPNPVLTFVPALAGSTEVDSNRIVFTPTGKMAEGTQYGVTLAAGISDTSGNATSSTSNWIFTTAANAFVSPVDGTVTTDSLAVDISAADTNDVDRVELMANGSAVGTPDTSPPYEFLWDASAEPLGAEDTLTATIYDTTGAMSWRDTIVVYHQWRLLIADDSLETDFEGVIPRDLKTIYVRSTTSQLQFRVETTRGWNQYKSPAEGIDVAIFIDADQNAATGQTSVSGYPTNDVGVDYHCIIGLHGDSLAVWNGSSWPPVGSGLFDVLNIRDSSNFFEVGVNLSRIGSPDAVDVVVANVTNQQQTPGGRWDWAPNQGSGHATYVIDNSYTGDIAISKSVTGSAHKSKRASLTIPNPFE